MTATTNIKYCTICKTNITECKLPEKVYVRGSYTTAPHKQFYISVEISLEEYHNNISNNIWPNLARKTKESLISNDEKQGIALKSAMYAEEILGPRPNTETNDFFIYSFLFFLTCVTIIIPVIFNTLGWLGCESNISYIKYITDSYIIDPNVLFPNIKGTSQLENNWLTKMFYGTGPDKFAHWVLMIIFNFLPSYWCTLLFENQIKNTKYKNASEYSKIWTPIYTKKYDELIDEKTKSIQI
jgi:hypothetical protein